VFLIALSNNVKLEVAYDIWEEGVVIGREREGEREGERVKDI